MLMRYNVMRQGRAAVWRIPASKGHTGRSDYRSLTDLSALPTFSRALRVKPRSTIGTVLGLSHWLMRSKIHSQVVNGRRLFSCCCLDLKQKLSSFIYFLQLLDRMGIHGRENFAFFSFPCLVLLHHLIKPYNSGINESPCLYIHIYSASFGEAHHNM